MAKLITANVQWKNVLQVRCGVSVSAQLDKMLVEPFQTDYDELLRAARKRLARGYEGLAPGVAEAG